MADAEIQVLSILGAAGALYTLGSIQHDFRFDKTFTEWGQQVAKLFTSSSAKSDASNPRNWVQKMKETGKRIAIVYGSQTGTAASYAIKLAKEAKDRFGQSSLVIDPSKYDFDCLDQLPEDSIVIFIVAAYGEGDATEIAQGLYNFLQDPKIHFSKGTNNLHGVKFAVCGLGNRNYTFFANQGVYFNKRLRELGAERIGPLGLCDESHSTEEDYMTWKEPMLLALAQALGLSEADGGESKDFDVVEIDPSSIKDEAIYKGEYSETILKNEKGDFNAKNPYPAPLIFSKELFGSNSERNAIHMEYDISGTGLRYQAGDHLGVHVNNPEKEVWRLLKVLGLDSKASTYIGITALDPSISAVPFPQPTTYEAAVRFYLDIGAVASRAAIAAFAKFAPTKPAKEKMAYLGNNKLAYQKEVADKCLKIAEVMIMAAGGDLDADPRQSATRYDVYKVPFDKVISAIPRLQPRYYSISSSPNYCAGRVSTTTVVLKYQAGEKDITPGKKMNYGLGSNFIFNVKMHMNKDADPEAVSPKYITCGPRDKFLHHGQKVPIHIRKSTFRLPITPRIPIIMIGPGTGVAPFRGFLQDRVDFARRLKSKYGFHALQDWGDMHLFFGCRDDSDFLYNDEWDEYAKELDGKFFMHTAFSRKEGIPKTYVQHLLDEQAEALKECLVEKKGYLYICGDAKNMAKAVEEKLAELIGEALGQDAEAGTAYLRKMKIHGKWMLDVWG